MSAGFALDAVGGARAGRALFGPLSLTLAAGGAALVTGPNGAGKSTLLRIAAGLLAAEAGRVVCAGARAWLGEAAALDPARRLGDALGFWAALDGGGEARARVRAALDEVALGTLAAVPVRYLSTGQRRRAAFARVIASGAPIWLLDEPANGLDRAATTRLEATLARHRAGGGIAVVATHLPIALPGAIPLRLGDGA